MMKRKGAMGLALLCAMGLLLSACGGGGGKADTPESAVSGYIDEIKKGNVESAQAYLAAPDAVQDMDSIAQAAGDRVKESAAGMSYEIVSSTTFEDATLSSLEGDAGEAEAESAEGEAAYSGALVIANITNKDMNAVAQHVAAQMMAESENFASMSEKDMQKFWDDAVKKAVSETTESVTTKVNFAVINDGGSWKIKEADDFYKAAFGLGEVLDF